MPPSAPRPRFRSRRPWNRGCRFWNIRPNITGCSSPITGQMDSFLRSLVPENRTCSFEIGQPDVAVRFGHAENDLVAGDREANTGNLLGGHERTPRLMEVIHGERRSQGALAGGVQALCPKAAEAI